MSKGSRRRNENTALVEANWEAIFGPARTEEQRFNDDLAELRFQQDIETGNEPVESPVQDGRLAEDQDQAAK